MSPAPKNRPRQILLGSLITVLFLTFCGGDIFLLFAGMLSRPLRDEPPLFWVVFGASFFCIAAIVVIPTKNSNNAPTARNNLEPGLSFGSGIGWLLVGGGAIASFVWSLFSKQGPTGGTVLQAITGLICLLNALTKYRSFRASRQNPPPHTN